MSQEITRHSLLFTVIICIMGTSRGPSLEQALLMYGCQHTTEDKHYFEELTPYSKTSTGMKERH